MKVDRDKNTGRFRGRTKEELIEAVDKTKIFEDALTQITFQFSPNTKKAESDIEVELRNFTDFGKETVVSKIIVKTAGDDTFEIPTFVNEYWTSKQRDGHSLHEISYRACFKAELPDFFIKRFTKPGEVVFDPFLGRGTTALQAALSGRIAFGCDVNPLSKVLLEPRFSPPLYADVTKRLSEIQYIPPKQYRSDLEVFFHPNTLTAICALREYFLEKGEENLDATDRWIRMVAINRLTGHSKGFFSVYTLPPNQAVSIESQTKINKDRSQIPDERDTVALILKKTKSLLRDETNIEFKVNASRHKVITADSRIVTPLPPNSVSLVVTSPPFLDVVNYASDNWMRCWFIGIDPSQVKITMSKKISDWEDAMTEVFLEMKRLLKSGGHIAFEVGDVRGGKILLEESVVRCALNAGFEPQLILINAQVFTKTANIWGVSNQTKGTNTNRVVLLRKPS